MNWYYADKGSQVGPINEDEFQLLVKKGTIQSDSLFIFFPEYHGFAMFQMQLKIVFIFL